MTEAITISFVATTEIKSWLERWATEDDRSVSYIIRKILEREAQRRAAETQREQQSLTDKESKVLRR